MNSLKNTCVWLHIRVVMVFLMFLNVIVILQFFVASDPSAPRERLWQEEYSLHLEMVPSFIPRSLAQKVYIKLYDLFV